MIVTLTTDFGNADGYVGVLKGVILRIAPDATIVDISHEIPPCDVRAAAWVLNNSYSYFPSGTIHLAIVDPGVGSERRGLVLKSRQFTFVGPDNGLFSEVLGHVGPVDCYWLNKPYLWRTEVSTTFHGRDVFAPIVGHLLKGKSPADVGDAIQLNDLQQLEGMPLNIHETVVDGAIVYVDRFGNLITNVPSSIFETGKTCLIEEHEIPFAQTYSSVEAGAAAAVAGSHGYIEIGVNQGRADTKFKASAGTALMIKLK